MNTKKAEHENTNKNEVEKNDLYLYSNINKIQLKNPLKLNSKVNSKKNDFNVENNFINNKNQRKCNEDWVCIQCHNLNYSFRDICNRCNVQTKKDNFPVANNIYNLNYSNYIKQSNINQIPYNCLNKHESSVKTVDSEYNTDNYVKTNKIQDNKIRKHSLSNYEEIWGENKEYAFEKEVLYWSFEENQDNKCFNDNDIDSIESTQKILSFLNFD